MAFQDIQSKRPSRPASPIAPASPNAFPPPPASADFSDIYEPDAQAPQAAKTADAASPKRPVFIAPSEPAPQINPKLERLIEIVCESLGSTPEEVRDLKARALLDPAPIDAFCSAYYNEEIRPRRERVDPLAEAISERPECFCFKYILATGESAVLCVNRLARPELALYHNTTLTHYPDEEHPFHEEPEPKSEPRMY